ncbi:hypothetical protein CLV80_10456 [Yoonia maritima]|uniref:Uncharacterized protein n=1 Tax=Yoonia maritima TaxID=1435347 RepID=A0A2T0VZZ9_9RHOB|nr:hypothetical protein CLV80_10456 [Yoonia maritima]
MLPSWIIEPIDILEYSPFGLTSGFPAVPPDWLILDGFEERFHDGIVVTITLGAAKLWLMPSDLLSTLQCHIIG